MNNKKKFSVVSDQRNRENEKTGAKDTNKITDIDSVLKDHLKASISMDRLEVSEDLVQRTLQKIKQSEGGIVSDDDNRREQLLKKRNIKGFISAAAAIVLVVTSVTVWQSGIITSNNKAPSKKDEMRIMEAAPVTESAKGSSKEYGIMADTNESAGNDLTAKSTDDSSDAGDAASGIVNSAESALVTPENGKVDLVIGASPTFSMYYAISSYKDVTSFIVTKDKKSVKVTDKAAKTEELYKILDRYDMSALTNPPKEDWIYKADMKLKDNKEITVYVWEEGNLAVTNEVSKEKSYYSLKNGEAFLKDFKDFLSSID